MSDYIDIGNRMEVSNFDEVKLHLRDELSILAQKLDKSIAKNKADKPLSEIEVSNFEIVTNSLKKIEEAINSLQLSPNFTPNINVSVPDVIVPEIVIPEIKVPKSIVNVEAPNVTVNPAEVNIDVSSILKALSPIQDLIKLMTNTVEMLDRMPQHQETLLEELARESNRNMSNLSAVFSGGVVQEEKPFLDTNGVPAKANLDSNGYLKVSVLSTVSGSATPFNEFAEDAAVVSTVETTIVTYTPVGVTARIQGIMVTGSATGRFKLKVAGVTKAIIRTSASERTVSTDFKDGYIQATAGQAVTLTAFHEEVANQAMAGNIFGYTS